MKLNHDKLRASFVNFDDKKKLTVQRDEFVKGGQNDWPSVFSEFS